MGRPIRHCNLQPATEHSRPYTVTKMAQILTFIEDTQVYWQPDHPSSDRYTALSQSVFTDKAERCSIRLQHQRFYQRIRLNIDPKGS